MESLMQMDVLRCDGRTAESVRRTGDVPGHIVPFLALFCWGLHLFIGATWRYVLAARDPTAEPFHIRTWEPLLPFIPFKLWQRINQLVPFDSCYKTLCPIFLVSFGFPYHQIQCDDGVRYGHIVGQRVVQWAHSTLMMAFVPVGLVELAEWVRVRFPANVSLAAGVVAHIVVSIIFLFHAKHELLDEATHSLVGRSFVLAALCDIIALFQPTSFLALCAILFFHMLGGLWLGVTGLIIFGKYEFWNPVSDGHTDVTPAIFAPVVFGYAMLGIVAMMLLIYTLLDVAAARSLGQKPLADGMPYACMSASAAADEREGLLVPAVGCGEAVDCGSEGRDHHLVRFR